MTPRRRLRIVLGGVGGAEGGFTLIEVLVAAVILALGAAAVLMTLVSGIHNVQRGKETQVAADVAQREMEKVRSLPFDEVALASAPKPTTAESNEVSNPYHRLVGTSYDLQRGGTEAVSLCIVGSGECASQSVAKSGKVVAGPSSSCVGGKAGSSFPAIAGTSGQVYCFVTVQKDPSCGTTVKTSCAIKRVIVDVWLSKPSNSQYRQPYYELQSDFVDTEPET